MDDSIGTVILAAGKGSRIGTPKIYLKTGGSYFIDIICENLFHAGIEKITSVISSNIDTSCFHYNDIISWVVNLTPDLGMISSIYTGINSLPGKIGYLIVPVDHPKILSETFRNLVQTFLANSESIVIAAYKNTPGHPIIIPKSISDNIEKKDYKDGLRGIIHSSGSHIIYCETNDPGVIININSKEDLSNL